jgi:hypothetical protein
MEGLVGGTGTHILTRNIYCTAIKAVPEYIGAIVDNIQISPDHELKRQCHERFSTSGFFHELVFPNILSISFWLFRIFRKFSEIFAAQGANGKNLQSEKC